MFEGIIVEFRDTVWIKHLFKYLHMLSVYLYIRMYNSRCSLICNSVILNGDTETETERYREREIERERHSNRRRTLGENSSGDRNFALGWLTKTKLSGG